MNQEDYNSMMRLPGETKNHSAHENKKCPKCDEKYLGNGVDLCADCELEKKNDQA